MLPSFDSLATMVAAAPMTERSYLTDLRSVHREPLPSIFELVPELSDHASSKFIDSYIRTSAEPRDYVCKAYDIKNICDVLSSPPQISKRRRLSIDDDDDYDDEDEERKYPRQRDLYQFLGQSNKSQQTFSFTPDPSPSSRSSTFSSGESRLLHHRTSPCTVYSNPNSIPSSRKSPITSRKNSSGGSPSCSETSSRSQSVYPSSSSRRQSQESDWEISTESVNQPESRYLPSIPLLNLANPNPSSQTSYSSENEYSYESFSNSFSSLSRVEPPRYSSCSSISTYGGNRRHSITNRHPNSASTSPTITDYQPLRENSLYSTKNSTHGCHPSNKGRYLNGSPREKKPRKRRGNLPKDTTDILRAWFFSHLEHPYPTEDEKQQLMDETGLQMNQISNWYINARRRQLPAIAANARAEAEARRLSQRSSSETIRRK